MDHEQPKPLPADERRSLIQQMDMESRNSFPDAMAKICPFRLRGPGAYSMYPALLESVRSTGDVCANSAKIIIDRFDPATGEQVSEVNQKFIDLVWAALDAPLPVSVTMLETTSRECADLRLRETFMRIERSTREIYRLVSFLQQHAEPWTESDPIEQRISLEP